MRIRRTLFLVAFLLVLYIVPMNPSVSYDSAVILPEKNMFLASDTTLILRPDGDVWTNLTKSGGSFNYEMVDEVTHDSDATTVYRTTPPVAWDRYTLENHTTEFGPINNLTVCYYAKKTASGAATRGHGIADSSATNATSGNDALTITYDLYNTTYSTKPSGGAWTWDAVDNAEVLLALGGVPVPATIGYCTQVYVVVNYIVEWHEAAELELLFPVPIDRWGLTTGITLLGLVMIPVSGLYLVKGGRKEASNEKLFYALILFFTGCGLLVGGIMP